MGAGKKYTVTLPWDLVDGVEEVAERDGLSSSAFLRKAISSYVHEREMDYLNKYGSEEAKRLGIKKSDIPRLVREVRAEMAAEEAERAKSSTTNP